MMSKQKTKQSGLTLLELLVVLIMVGLISTVLTQGLAQLFQLRQRVRLQADQQQFDFLREDWFVNSVAGLVTTYQGTEQPVFTGDSEQFSGFSLASLQQLAGVPEQIAWRIVQNNAGTELRYYSGELDWPILQWQEGEARFQYLSVQGEWEKVWPPNHLAANTADLSMEALTLLGLSAPSTMSNTVKPQLPQAILFTLNRPRYPVMWLSELKNYKFAPIDTRSIFLD